MNGTTSRAEPNFATACGWWSDLPNIWTPVGWEGHLFRFSLLWDGTIIAPPHLNRRSESWKDQGAQISCRPLTGHLPGDDGWNTQGWNEGAAPVLWTEKFTQGILYRQEVFAHVPGGRAVERGDEPLFAWVRLTLADTVEALPLDDETAFDLAIQGVHLYYNMSMRNNVCVVPDEARYPRSLTLEGSAAEGTRVVESDGRVRLGVAPNTECCVSLTAPNRHDTSTRLIISGLAVRKGTSVDLLLPMIPADRATFDRELALGYEGALQETAAFWSERRARRTTIFQVPEPFINDAAEHSTRFSRLLAETNPATGKRCKISGSPHYADLWSTPIAMDLIMLMDTLGEHRFVEPYLEIFKEEQGTVTPPGDAYSRHPGYLSSPALYKSIDWLCDNGALLYTLSMHGLLSGDADYIARFTDTIVKSCEWIKTHRALKGHGGCEGILPAAVATDNGTSIQAVWSDGWNYKGLCAAVRLLKRIGHARAAEFAQDARDYKAAYLAALRDKCRMMPTWTDAHGGKHVLVPTALSGDKRSETRHPFYLDAGPLFLVFSGLVEADDPLMCDVLLWFREGPQKRYYRHDTQFWQIPCLDHEMSSCEPCYSWNVFHSWQLGDREKFLEGMYSLFAGSLSRKTYISCETRGGITGNVFSAPLAIYLARLAVIDDEWREDELHLLRFLPQAWCVPGQPAVFEAVPTEFGPVSLRLELSADGGTLDVTFRPEYRQAPERAVLHTPPLDGLKNLRINGCKLDVFQNKTILEGV
jgi:hypothetical protein